jgi:hypothetical protein
VLNIHRVNVESYAMRAVEIEWCGPLVPQDVELATDARNPLKKYY